MPCSSCGAPYGHAPGCPYALAPVPPPPPRRSPAVVVAAVIGGAVALIAVLSALLVAFAPAVLLRDQGPLPPRRTAITADELVGTWTGGYTCSGKARALKLTVQPAGQALEAEFVFYRGSDPVGDPHGSYAMSGDLADGVVTFKGTRWISRPAGYAMVDLSGTPRREPDGALTFTGTPTRCENFMLTKRPGS
ncbi:hypothetical protein EDD29_8821 [Actinocorallia herbida]|uniref:Uncharacterized protein n=1 Tax=Actinocorallia herbida TaxID=58109 RepID=A0A3N1DC22_9ACTN|nr:hypothetical protein [Actinocorallia herbida]ROO91074.1 hypothetical protein EDD29_8821 [Actinocorallia herbida]